MNILKSLSFAAATVAALSFGMGQASASAIFDFSFTGTDVSGSGQIDTTGSGGQLTVTGVTGTIFDSDVAAGPFVITGLSSYANSDSFLFQPAPFADFDGISVSTSDGGDFNIANIGGGQMVLASSILNPGGNTSPVTDITLTVTAVPEPATIALLGLGLLGFALARRKSGNNNA